MAENLVSANSIVPEVLKDDNYEIWSSCIKNYLLGQDLWDVIEPETDVEETETIVSSSSPPNSSKKIWRKKNAMALHAIQMSCDRKFLSEIAKLESAKDAWDRLESIAGNTEQLSTGTKVEEPAKSISEEEKSEGKAEEQIVDQTSTIDDDERYTAFIKAAKEGDLSAVKSFLDSDPEALTATVFQDRGTALHQALTWGHEKIAEFLVDKMTPANLEIEDEDGYTTFSLGAFMYYPGLDKLLRRMLSKNPKLANIGNQGSMPIVAASLKGHKDLTRFLYGVTEMHILSPERGKVGARLLINCINAKIFDVALDLLQKFPDLIRERAYDTYPVLALAKVTSAFPSGSGQKSRIEVEHNKSSIFSQCLFKCGACLDMLRQLGDKNMSNDQKFIHDQALAFLHFVCEVLSTYDHKMMKDTSVLDAMFIAAKNGNAEFVVEMIRANHVLIWVSDEDDKSIFWYAVEHRQEKVFNLIYGIIASRGVLLSRVKDKDDNNILHIAAILAPSSVLDRTSGAALQMQRELQWFKEVESLVKSRYKEDVNKEDLTPRELFTKSHRELVKQGERWMKETAQSSTVVGALIVTIMFAAAFTVPGGSNQDTGLPIFLGKVLFKIFIINDALSLFSSTTSVLVFLGILTSRYTEDSFLVSLPRKLMIALSSLFFSLATMLVAFCTALAIMLDGRLAIILPVVLLAFVPIVLFLSSILPLLYEIYISTFGQSIFDRNTKLPSKKEDKKKTIRPSIAEV